MIMTSASFSVEDNLEAVEKPTYVYDALYSYDTYKLFVKSMARS
jgi:hypothetical protein